MDTGTLIVYIKKQMMFLKIFQRMFKLDLIDNSNNELHRPLPKGKYIKVIRFVKDKLGGKIMTNC